jgi:hypothetical protein
MKRAYLLQFVIVLLMNFYLTAGVEVRAQTRNSAEKRSFAELLARRANDSAARSEETAIGAGRAAQSSTRALHAAGLSGDHRALAASHPAVGAHLRPLTSGAVYGMAPSTNVVPCCNGSPRDAFVESLYAQMLGRMAEPYEVEYWARHLVLGATPHCVAERIWQSQEHQSLVRNGDSPGIPFETALRDALAAAQKSKKK